MRSIIDIPRPLWLPLLALSLHLHPSFSLNCDKTFTYYEEYGLNSFNVTCDGITKGYEHILENITINNEISLTLTNSVLENITPNIFKNVRNIKMLSISNTTFDFNRKLPIFEKLSKLETLIIRNTYFEVHNVTMQNLGNLKTLELRNNSLSVIEKGGLKFLNNLEKLQITNNHVKSMNDLRLCELKNLQTLTLRNNLLTDLNKFYFFCRKMPQNIDFNVNKKPALPQVLQNAFFNITNVVFDLKDLDLSYNQFVDLGFSLDHLEKLRILNLENNKLLSIKHTQFKSLYKVEKLVLRNNEIRSFESRFFLNKTQLFYVDLSNNNLQEITVADAPKLQFLNLANNNLSSISFSNLTSLKQLNLASNNLRAMSAEAFQKVPSIVSLNLDGNYLVLTTGLFQNLFGLKYLKLRNNSIQVVPEKVFSGLKNLKGLDLSYNKIVFVNANTFHDLDSLEILNISNNLIESLSYLDIENLKNLRSLDVEANRLKFIEYDLILSKLPGLSNINIRSNLLTCESLMKIVGFLKQKHISYTSSEHFDLEKINQNVAGIPCKAANRSFIVAVEARTSPSNTLFNFGIIVITMLVAVIMGIVTYRFYIYLKRRKYRADEFELVDE